MKKLLLLVLLLPNILLAQKVGIGTTNPQEKLDVNGNINVNGTIKANGIAGQPGQVLVTNNAGNLQWNSIIASADPAYSNFVSFYGVIGSSDTWLVPAGVSKIMVEAWGGGGGGSISGAGGGGGYVRAEFTVTPGHLINITIGYAGAGASGTESGHTGGNTMVAVPSNGTIWYAAATGGTGGFNNPISPFASNYATGGSFYVADQYPIVSGYTLYPAFLGAPGECGYPNYFTYTQVASNTFLSEATGGRGGDAGNSIKTGGSSARNFSDNNQIISRYGGMPGVFGGGGAAGIAGVSIGQPGGKGKAVIWY